MCILNNKYYIFQNDMYVLTFYLFVNILSKLMLCFVLLIV